MKMCKPSCYMVWQRRALPKLPRAVLSSLSSVRLWSGASFGGQASRPAGALRITTEFGILNVLPGQIAVVQRGMRCSVALPGGPARGYVLEVFGGHFALPDLGLIGGA